MVSVLLLSLAIAATVTLAFDSTDVSLLINTDLVLRNRIWFQTCKVAEEYDKSESKDGQFVVFRVITNSGNPSDNENLLDLEYVVPLEEYLSALIPRNQQQLRDDCENAPDKDFCWHEKIKENGYVDASDFSTCKLIDETGPFYAGPRCFGGDGSVITIAVFKDPQCTIPDPTKLVDDYLKDECGKRLHLSYTLLQRVYLNDYERFFFEEQPRGIYCEKPMFCRSLFFESYRCQTRLGTLFPPMTEEEERDQQEVCAFIKKLKNEDTPDLDQHSPAVATNSFPSQSLKNAVAKLYHNSFVPRDIDNYKMLYASCRVAKDYEKRKSKDGQFVIFRICFFSAPFWCRDDKDFGEYAVPLEDYLAATIPHQQREEAIACDQCKHSCKKMSKGIFKDSCIHCSELCSKIDGMEDNGFVDATRFSRCQMVNDDDSNPLFAGPVCSGIDGSEISVGVFKDPECTIPDPTKQVDDYLKDDNGNGLKLSYDMLQRITGNINDFSSIGKPKDELRNKGISCQLDGFCGSLYLKSERCETRHGFSLTKLGLATEDAKMREEEACNFIESLKNGQHRFAEETLVFQSCKVFHDHAQFVTFRLCRDRNDPSSCSSNEYVVTLDEYLSHVIPHQRWVQREVCNNCRQEICDSDPKRWEWVRPRCSSCSGFSCLDDFQMRWNGYMEATKFSHCKMIDYTAPDDDLGPLYAGPVCSDDSSAIKIGVFDDSDCTVSDPAKQITDYLFDYDGKSLDLSYELLQSAFGNDGISCNDAVYLDNVDVCQALVVSAEENQHGGYLATTI